MSRSKAPARTEVYFQLIHLIHFLFVNKFMHAACESQRFETESQTFFFCVFVTMYKMVKYNGHNTNMNYTVLKELCLVDFQRCLPRLTAGFRWTAHLEILNKVKEHLQRDLGLLIHAELFYILGLWTGLFTSHLSCSTAIKQSCSEVNAKH